MIIIMIIICLFLYIGQAFVITDIQAIYENMKQTQSNSKL